MPPPPPSPMCFPGFEKKKEPKRLTDLIRSNTEKPSALRPSTTLARYQPVSPRPTSGGSGGIRDSLDEEDKDEKLAFDSDLEAYEEVRALPSDSRARAIERPTPATPWARWQEACRRSGAYGWGVGKPKLYSDSCSLRKTNATGVSKRTGSRPNLWASDSRSTLVGSAFERKLNDLDVPKERVDSSDRPNDLRRLMEKDTLDCYEENGYLDWINFLLDRAKDSRIVIDARMLVHDKATAFNSMLTAKNSKLIYPPQSIDLIWKDKPARSKERIFVQPLEFTGRRRPIYKYFNCYGSGSSTWYS
ncbi:hypothetical protein FIBSPDRAFT_928041 [Athelia psychrophila]|uniref:Uncharacterized protein n=1 Tax=Athelia psychrophila TaxID=1759441 RepID=A0A166QT74_9AGAM|nr:hypothetical protein FIBSPDRAFT_928041 [Fibularhizoctonia sp. CBS 109695]